VDSSFEGTEEKSHNSRLGIMKSIGSAGKTFSIQEIHSAADLERTRGEADIYAFPSAKRGKYITGIAGTRRCVEEALRLRFKVFNIELGEGLDSSRETGLDEDEFDDQMTHLVLFHKRSGELVGTYRMQTVTQAMAAGGIYSAREYDLEQLEPYFDKLVELGRACLAVEHRKLAAIINLWLGIGGFMNLHNSRYLFGCCSLTSANPDDGWRALKTIRRKGYLHPELLLPAKEAYSCGPASRENDPELSAIPLPKLFRAYIRIGSEVISEPAIDREFGTVDFLVLLDGYRVKKKTLDVLG